MAVSRTLNIRKGGLNYEKRVVLPQPGAPVIRMFLFITKSLNKQMNISNPNIVQTRLPGGPEAAFGQAFRCQR